MDYDSSGLSQASTLLIRFAWPLLALTMPASLFSQFNEIKFLPCRNCVLSISKKRSDEGTYGMIQRVARCTTLELCFVKESSDEGVL
jgi:hypothetical protein